MVLSHEKLGIYMGSLSIIEMLRMGIYTDSLQMGIHKQGTNGNIHRLGQNRNTYMDSLQIGYDNEK